jgi:hypothetical protein
LNVFPPPALRRARCLVEILRSSARRPPGPYLRPAGPGCPSPFRDRRILRHRRGLAERYCGLLVRPFAGARSFQPPVGAGSTKRATDSLSPFSNVTRGNSDALNVFRKWRNFPEWETIMKTGQKIRLRSSSRGGLEWRIPRESVGTVICCYQVFAGSPRASDRVDVQFNPETIVWGAPAREFEEIPEFPPL